MHSCCLTLSLLCGLQNSRPSLLENEPKERVSVRVLGAEAWMVWRDFNDLVWEVDCFQWCKGRLFLCETETCCIICVVLVLLLKCRTGKW